jgi:ankyrin repeat protein
VIRTVFGFFQPSTNERTNRFDTSDSIATALPPLKPQPAPYLLTMATTASSSSSSSSSGFARLHTAAKAGDCDTIRTLLDEGIAVDAKDKNALTALHYAALKGKVDAVALLMERKLDPNITDECGLTPLHYAAGTGRTSVAGMFH